MERDNVTELSEEIRAKLKARKEVKEHFNSDDWTIPQIILQDIQAEDEVIETATGSTSSLADQIKRMNERIAEEFKDDAETLEIVQKSVPTYNTVRRWTKTKEWQDAVMKRIRSSHVFKNTNRTKVLENILKLATTPSGGAVKAAELYFKLEGSLDPNKDKDKKTELDDVFDRFKDLQKTLHRK